MTTCAEKAERSRNSAIWQSVFAFLPLLFLSVCLLSCGSGTTGGGGTGTQLPCSAPPGSSCDASLVVSGVTRTYRLHVPSNFQKNTGALLIVLHGSGSNGSAMENLTGFSPLADQAGFTVVYPDGLTNPATGQSDWAYYFNDFTDDIGFIRQLVGTLQASVAPNPKTIHVAGHSSGGFMAHRVGVELSDLVASIGVVEGAVESGGNPPPVPAVAAPVSVIMLHGDQDQTVPYCGSRFDASQEDTFNYWKGSSADNCSTLNTQSPLCDSRGNITTVVEKVATGCGGNTEVKFYKLIGGVHAWNNRAMDDPSLTPYNPSFDSNTGVTTPALLWNFFTAHPKL